MLKKKFYYLIFLCFISIILPDISEPYGSLHIIDKPGFRIYSAENDIEYALNISSVIEEIYLKTTEIAGFEPAVPLNIYIANKNYSNSLSESLNTFYDSKKIILFVDDDYSRSIVRLWDFTVSEVLAELNNKSSGFSVSKYISAESWLPGTLSVYLRDGLPHRDKMILKSMVFNNTVLSLNPSSQKNYSKDETEAVYRGFIFFIAESFGDVILTAALKNISYYGGFLKAVEKITGQGQKDIEREFNHFFTLTNSDADKREVSIPDSDHLKFFDNNNFLIMAATEKGEMLILDKTHKSLEFLKINEKTNSDYYDFNNYSTISSIPFDSTEETLLGAFYNNNRAVISVPGKGGTSFYLYNYIEKKLERKFFIPYLYIKELSKKHLHNSIIFSAVEGTRKDIFIFNIDSMSVKKITESKGEYSHPAVYDNNSIIFLNKSDKTRVYKYNFLENKFFDIWETDGVIKDLTVAENNEIFFSWNRNDVFNIFILNIGNKDTSQLTFFNTGAFNPLVFVNNKIIIYCYMKRKLKMAVLD